MMRGKATAIERECDQAIAELLRVREMARTAQHEGVIGVRRCDA